MKKLNKYNYDIEQLQWEWNGLRDRLLENMWHIAQGNLLRQTCLQHSTECHDVFTEGCGSFKDTNRKESDYNILNDFYENTLFETIINDHKVCRSRIMMMEKHSTYSIHRDKVSRYHLAIETNPDAYFLFPRTSTLEHVPADGYVYEVDTTQDHTFVNCGPDRTHLVMVNDR